MNTGTLAVVAIGVIVALAVSKEPPAKKPPAKKPPAKEPPAKKPPAKKPPAKKPPAKEPPAKEPPAEVIDLRLSKKEILELPQVPTVGLRSKERYDRLYPNLEFDYDMLDRSVRCDWLKKYETLPPRDKNLVVGVPRNTPIRLVLKYYLRTDTKGVFSFVPIGNTSMKVTAKVTGRDFAPGPYYQRDPLYTSRVTFSVTGGREGDYGMLILDYAVEAPGCIILQAFDV